MLGAGLAGLSAARDLESAGATVTVVEARDRVGGRVHTITNGLSNRQHAEAGADLIEEDQRFVLKLARELKLKTVRILRAGFGYYTPDRAGRRRIRSGPGAFEESARRLRREIDDYCLAGKRWDSAVAVHLAQQSVADWLDRERVSDAFRASVCALRGFFVADPEDLSLIALVDQFASGGTPGQSRIFRIQGGNERLPRAIAKALRGEVLLQTVVRRIRQNGAGVRVTVADPRAAGGAACRLLRGYAAGVDAARCSLPAGSASRADAGNRDAALRRCHPHAAPVREAVLAQARTGSRVRLRPADRCCLGRIRGSARALGNPESARRWQGRRARSAS